MLNPASIPDMLQRLRARPDAMSGLTERLGQCSDYYTAFTLTGLCLDLGRGAQGLTPDARDRVYNRALSLIKKALEEENPSHVRIEPWLVREDDLMILGLGLADWTTYRTVLRNVLVRFREDLYGNLMIPGSSMRRELWIGVAAWHPGEGYVKPEEVLERAVQSLHLAATATDDASYDLLRMDPSDADRIFLYEYPPLMPEEAKPDAEAPAKKKPGWKFW